MKCPKCGSTALYGVNSPLDKRNKCAECGLSNEPGNHPYSLMKQLGMNIPLPKEDDE